MISNHAARGGAPTTRTQPVEVTVVHSDGCHLCDDAIAALDEFSREHPLTVRLVEFDSPEGRELHRRFRPPIPPLILVDGELFGWGRLSRRKLVKRLGQL